MKMMKIIKMNKLVVVLLCCFFSNLIFAQMGDLDKMMQQMLDQQRRMLEEMEKGDSSFDDYVNKMFERLRGNAFGTFSGDTFEIGRKAVRSYWEETDKERTLIVEFQNEKDKIDIKIENGMVNFSGIQINEVKNDKGEVVSSSRSQFSSSVGIPRDVDADNPKMKKVDKKIHISFKKISSKNVDVKKDQNIKKSKPIIPKGSKKDI